MKFGLLSIAALATGVAADVATIKGVFNQIGQLTGQLADDVQSFSGDGSDITSDASALLSATKAGTQKISSSGDLSQSEALQLQSVVGGLQKQVNAAVEGLIDKKSEIIDAGLGQQVYQSLQAQDAAAQDLADATTDLVPQALQQIASQLSGGISKELQKGISAYQGAPSGGSSSTSESSSPSTSGPASYSSTAAPSSSMYTSTTPTYPTATQTQPSGTGVYTPTGTGPTSPIPTNAGALNTVSGTVGILAVLAAAIGM